MGFINGKSMMLIQWLIVISLRPMERLIASHTAYDN